MHLRRLAVTDFRSWEAAELDLAPGITVLVGPNGVGKTNLVEAAGYLATLGSHRVATDAPLIRRGRRAGRRPRAGGAPRPRALGRGGDHLGPGEPGAGQPGARQAARRAGHPAHGPVRPGGPRAGPRRSRRAPSLPRRAPRRPLPPLRQRPRRLRPGAAPAHRPAQDGAGAARWRPAHARRLGRPPRHPRRGAAGRPAGARRGDRPACGGGVRGDRALVAADRAALPLLGRHRRGPPGVRAAGGAGAACAARRWSAGCASSARTATTSSSASATGPPRGTRATASRGRSPSRSGWRPTGCCATTTSSPSSSSTTSSPSSTPAAAARSPSRPPRRAGVGHGRRRRGRARGARRRPLHGG